MSKIDVMNVAEDCLDEVIGEYDLQESETRQGYTSYADNGSFELYFVSPSGYEVPVRFKISDWFGEAKDYEDYSTIEVKQQIKEELLHALSWELTNNFSWTTQDVRTTEGVEYFKKVAKRMEEATA